MGLDSDDPRAAGEVGRLGVAMDTLDDMVVLFDGIKPGKDLRVNDHATHRRRCDGVLPGRRPGTRLRCRELRGTLQNDILKEFHAQNEFVFPPEPSERLVVRRDRVLCPARAAVEPGVDLRLPHPRGRLDRRPGAGFHAGRRLPLRRAVPGPGMAGTTSARPVVSLYLA